MVWDGVVWHGTVRCMVDHVPRGPFRPREERPYLTAGRPGRAVRGSKKRSGLTSQRERKDLDGRFVRSSCERFDTYLPSHVLTLTCSHTYTHTRTLALTRTHSYSHSHLHSYTLVHLHYLLTFILTLMLVHTHTHTYIHTNT